MATGLVWLFCVILAGSARANTVTVNTLEDLPGTSGNCSLRDAIDEIITPTTNPPPGDCGDSDPNGVDTITFSVTGTIALLAALPQIKDIDEGLNIVGPGARSLTISGNAPNDGVSAVQVLRVQPNEKVTIEGVTIANGRAPKNGGGIQNFGQLTVKNTSFIGNTALEDGGAISNEKPGQLTVLNSTFSGNFIDNETPQEEEGGAVLNLDGTATIANSTFFGNRVPNTGGAILNSGNNDGTGILTLINSTINGNTGSEAGGGIFTGGARLGFATRCSQPTPETTADRRLGVS